MLTIHALEVSEQSLLFVENVCCKKRPNDTLIRKGGENFVRVSY